MKVLVKVNELGLGGTQLNAVDFAAAARTHGIDSVVMGYRETLPREGPSLLDIARERDVPIEVLDQGPRGGRRERRQRAIEMAALADRHGAELVHAYGAWSARQAYWGPCRYARRPLVITVYEMYLPGTVYRKPHLIVGTTEMLEAHSRSRGNIHLISPPVDLERDRPGVSSAMATPQEFARADANIKVVIVSRLDDDMKAFGVQVAIRTVGRLGRDDVGLIVVGSGSAADRLQAEGREVNARLGRDAVRFTGALADPRPAYDQADVMLGMGGSAARALAFGKPLVVIGEHGWCRCFSPDTAAELFRLSFWSDEVMEQAEEALRRELTPLLDSPELRVQLGEFGRSFAERNFGLSSMTERMVYVYRAASESYGRAAWFADVGTEAINAGRMATSKVSDRIRRMRTNKPAAVSSTQ